MTSSTAHLRADRLLCGAAETTGLEDWGDETFVPRFRAAVAAIQSVPLPPDGQQAAAENCEWLLTDRLRFFDDHRRYELHLQTIDRPLFVTGEPRSGTTLLHALLAVDPHARALRFWEVMHPSPPPGPAAVDDPRRERADGEWREINRRLPQWLVFHPYNDMLGNGLPECERTWAFDFRAFPPTAWWRVPMRLPAGVLPGDPVAQYRIHKMMLQAIQKERPARRWVLKGFHTAHLGTLFDTYPDAHVLYVHRDPVQVLASRMMMTATLYEGLTGEANGAEHARGHLEDSRRAFHAIMTNPYMEDKRVLHVRYEDVMRDQIKTIREFYQFADKPFTVEADVAMRALPPYQ